MGKQLTPLEQAAADLKAAQKVHAAKQAALAKAYTAEQEAATGVKDARDRVRRIMDAELAEAEKATKAAVGLDAPTRTARPARPAARQDGQVALTEQALGNGHQVMA